MLTKSSNRIQRLEEFEQLSFCLVASYQKYSLSVSLSLCLSLSISFSLSLCLSLSLSLCLSLSLSLSLSVSLFLSFPSCWRRTVKSLFQNCAMSLPARSPPVLLWGGSLSLWVGFLLMASSVTRSDRSCQRREAKRAGSTSQVPSLYKILYIVLWLQQKKKSLSPDLHREHSERKRWNPFSFHFERARTLWQEEGKRSPFYRKARKGRRKKKKKRKKK